MWCRSGAIDAPRLTRPFHLEPASLVAEGQVVAAQQAAADLNAARMVVVEQGTRDVPFDLLPHLSIGQGDNEAPLWGKFVIRNRRGDGIDRAGRGRTLDILAAENPGCCLARRRVAIVTKTGLR